MENFLKFSKVSYVRKSITLAVVGISRRSIHHSKAEKKVFGIDPASGGQLFFKMALNIKESN